MATAATALAGAVLLQSPTPAGAAQEAGRVSRLQGSAEATTAGANRALAPKTTVFVADVVRTGAGSRLGIQLGERTTLNLGASSQVRIEKYMLNAGGMIDLVEGTILYEHDGPNTGKGPEFRSPYGLIAVRGTRFYAGPSNGAFGILVSTGRVEVTAGGKTVVVGPQQGTDISSPGAAPSEPKTWGLKRVRAMQAAVR